jgi:hypothetical protein
MELNLEQMELNLEQIELNLEQMELNLEQLKLFFHFSDFVSSETFFSLPSHHIFPNPIMQISSNWVHIKPKIHLRDNSTKIKSAFYSLQIIIKKKTFGINLNFLFRKKNTNMKDKSGEAREKQQS